MKSGSPFVLAKNQTPTRRRMIMLVYGGQKVGKTYFGLGAPGDVLYLPFEPGLEGVIEKFPKKNIYKPEIDYVFAKPPVKSKDMAKDAAYIEQVQAIATPIWHRFVSDWNAALKSDVRTIVVDTAGAMFDLGRFAYLGLVGKADTKSDPWGQKSGAVKSIVRGIVQDSYQYDKNLIFLAREKQLWEGGEPTDKWESDGNSGLPYEVQVVVRLTKQVFAGKTIRKATVVDSRIDGDFANSLVFSDTEGKNVAGPLSFVSIASTISGTDSSEWE